MIISMVSSLQPSYLWHENNLLCSQLAFFLSLFSLPPLTAASHLRWSDVVFQKFYLDISFNSIISNEQVLTSYPHGSLTLPSRSIITWLHPIMTPSPSILLPSPLMEVFSNHDHTNSLIMDHLPSRISPLHILP